MPESKHYQATFTRLKSVLQKYAKHLTVTTDTPSEYMLDARYAEQFKRTLFFGGVSIKKRYVSFYLMPVYVFPELLKGISPALKKRMQGKSCFNFMTLDDAMLKELAMLAKRGFEQYQREGFV